MIGAVNQLAGAVDIKDGCNEPRGRRGKKKKKEGGNRRKNWEENSILNNGWAMK